MCAAGMTFSNGRPITSSCWKSSGQGMLERLIVIGAATPTIIRIVDDINLAGSRKLEIVGFLDSRHAELGSEFYGFPLLGDFAAIEGFDPRHVVLINTIAGRVADRVKTTEHFL